MLEVWTLWYLLSLHGITVQTVYTTMPTQAVCETIKQQKEQDYPNVVWECRKGDIKESEKPLYRPHEYENKGGN